MTASGAGGRCSRFLRAVPLATALTAGAGSTVELAVLRLLTGVGLGGTIPLALALSAEQLPIGVRSTLLTVVIAATPLGSALASLLAPFLIDTWSWRAVFVAGAIAPAIALALAYALLPESQEWLTAKREPATLSALFAGERAIATPLLWLAFLANQFILLLLGSWLPTLLTGEDLSRDRALYATTVYSIGGMLSGPLLGWLSDRYRPQRGASRDLYAGDVRGRSAVCCREQHVHVVRGRAACGRGRFGIADRAECIRGNLVSDADSRERRRLGACRGPHRRDRQSARRRILVGVWMELA